MSSEGTPSSVKVTSMGSRLAGETAVARRIGVWLAPTRRSRVTGGCAAGRASAPSEAAGRLELRELKSPAPARSRDAERSRDPELLGEPELLRGTRAVTRIASGHANPSGRQSPVPDAAVPRAAAGPDARALAEAGSGSTRSAGSGPDGRVASARRRPTTGGRRRTRRRRTSTPLPRWPDGARRYRDGPDPPDGGVDVGGARRSARELEQTRCLSFNRRQVVKSAGLAVVAGQPATPQRQGRRALRPSRGITRQRP